MGDIGHHLEAEDLATVVADEEQGLSVVEGTMRELRLAYHLQSSAVLEWTHMRYLPTLCPSNIITIMC